MCVHCSTLHLHSSAGYSYSQGRGWMSAMWSHHDRRLAGQWTWNMITPPRTNLNLAMWKKYGHWKPEGWRNPTMLTNWKTAPCQGSTKEQMHNRNKMYRGTKEQYVRLLKYTKSYWWTDHIFTNKHAQKSSSCFVYVISLWYDGNVFAEQAFLHGVRMLSLTITIF